MRRRIVALSTLAAMLSAEMAAGQSLTDKLVNTAGVPTAWGTTGEAYRDPGVKGGVALRVKTTGDEATPATVGVYSAIDKPVRKGDRLILAFWAKLEKGSGDEPTVISYAAVQHAAPPNAAVFTGTATLGKDWQPYQMAGRADQDYEPGTLNVGIQLGGKKRVVDLGPLLVFDMGQ